VSFVQESKLRGFIHQATDLESIEQLTCTKPICGYIGYDLTAKSFHVGNLTTIMWMRLFQQCGHTVIIILGGGTSKIGDPSGRDESRQLMTIDTIAENRASLEKTFFKYLNKDQTIILNNDDWLSGLGYIDFLRDIGPHFTVNRLLTFESIKSRLDREQALSFIEFNYPLLQAYDFYVLAQKYDCVLEFGGSDQWGNIICGTELVRRKLGKQVYGMTCPLITTASGKKMGKTAQGAVWLDAELLSPFEFWQFWRNTEDLDVGRFLRLFTELPIEEIQELEQLKDVDINRAKRILADEVTRLCHGDAVLETIHKTAEELFYGQGQDIESIPLVTITVPEMRLDDLLVACGLCASKSEAKKAVINQGIKINRTPQTDPYATIQITNDEMLISHGKKKNVRIANPNQFSYNLI
jgi:tyrosyl-tRNA synthetase